MSQEQFNTLVALIDKKFVELKADLIGEIKAELKPELNSIVQAASTL